MPLLGVTYLLQFLDKISLGYSALLNLRADLGLKGSEYSWATAVFYFGYFFWTFPTSWLIIRLPLGKYLASVVVVWGAVLACHAACTGFAGLMVTRFILGMLEASIAPGFSYITGMFYKRDEQPLRHGIWYLGNSAAGLFGGVLAWGIGHIHGALWPWQYLFIIFGCITTAWGLVLLFFLPDAPGSAPFLTPDERLLAVERTSETRQKVDGKEFKMYQAWEALRDPQAWLLCVNMLGCMLVNSGFSAFIGIIIAGFGYSGLQALLYQMPGAAVQIGLVVITSLCGSYVRNSRTIMLAALSLLSIVGVVLVYVLDDSQRDAKLFGSSLMGAYASILPISMSMVSTNIVGNTKKTVVSAMLFVAYCVGNIVSPQVFLTAEEPRYPTGIKVCLAGLALGFVSAIVLRFYLQYCNRRNERKRSASGFDNPNENDEDKTDWEIKNFTYML
ncbi:major facilitator superfamily domain-containing protein [Aspergillus pseudodeflectus]|uniref:Major facilitator superfamily domain-containing protein n=1 Tax=Aspergillus pseudodeflectus TaxID=176178 RepID=A0ABR4JRQ7_9EURO